jgi:hypothetical protein
MTLLNISDNGIGQPAQESSYIKKTACKGTSFKVGEVVEYHGKQCKVTRAVDGDGELIVLIPADMSGVIAIVNAIPDMGAILSVNLLKNNIGVAQAEGLVRILKEHPTLKSLCGNTGNETELNMSGKMYGAADAILLVPEIIDNGALTSLNLASNSIGGYYHGYKNSQFTATPEGISYMRSVILLITNS